MSTMDKAARKLRRTGVKLISLSGGHADLNMAISEFRDVRNTLKAYITAQDSAIQYLAKWAAHEDNRAIQDVCSNLAELSMMWTETQRDHLEGIKTFNHTLDLLLEGEKHVDQGRTHLLQSEQREAKIKKELKKQVRKGAPTEEIRSLEAKLTQAEQTKHLAQIEVIDRTLHNELLKLTRFKDGMQRLSQDYITLGNKCAIIHEAYKEIIQQLPNVEGQDLEDVKYTGSGATKYHVMRAKDRVRQYNNRRQMYFDHQIIVDLPLDMQNAAEPDEEPPPPYEADDYYDHFSQPLMRQPSRHVSQTLVQEQFNLLQSVTGDEQNHQRATSAAASLDASNGGGRENTSRARAGSTADRFHTSSGYSFRRNDRRSCTSSCNEWVSSNAVTNASTRRAGSTVQRRKRVPASLVSSSDDSLIGSSSLLSRQQQHSAPPPHSMKTAIGSTSSSSANGKHDKCFRSAGMTMSVVEPSTCSSILDPVVDISATPLDDPLPLPPGELLSLSVHADIHAESTAEDESTEVESEQVSRDTSIDDVTDALGAAKI